MEKLYILNNKLAVLWIPEGSLGLTLNDTLSVFYFITKCMEGDISLAGMMLAEYHYIKTFLTKKIKSPTEKDFYQMFQKMIEKTKKYLNEALQCDAILLATILNPSYRVSMFQMWLPERQSYAQMLIQTSFDEKKAITKQFPLPKPNHPLAPLNMMNGNGQKPTSFLMHLTQTMMSSLCILAENISGQTLKQTNHSCGGSYVIHFLCSNVKRFTQ